jgi:Pyruvate/2-oxoacid:ferredoxin oxidoreductase delta subunit
MFGVIPGEKKAEYHMNSKSNDSFADTLIDIYLATKPDLTIMDAIIGMHGDGPTSGEAVNLGFILASTNGFAVDTVALNAVNIKHEIVPVMYMAKKRGLFSFDLKDIQIVGNSIDSIRYNNIFKYSQEGELKSINFVNNVFMKMIVNKVKAKPVFDYAKCIKCKQCEKACPAKVVTFYNDKPEIDYKNCIRCFCCHELCPVSAIKVKKSFLLKIIIKIGIKYMDYKAKKRIENEEMMNKEKD